MTQTTDPVAKLVQDSGIVPWLIEFHTLHPTASLILGGIAAIIGFIVFQITFSVPQKETRQTRNEEHDSGYY